MITQTLIAIAAFLTTVAASAQTASAAPPLRKSVPPTPAQILERLKARLPTVQCAASAVTNDATTVYKLAGGTSYEFVHEEGRIVAVTAIAPGGQRMRVDAVPASRGVPDGNAGKARVRPPRPLVHQAMEKFLRAECARFAATESGEAPAPAEAQLVAGTTSSADSMSADWDYADFLGFSDSFSHDAFESSSSGWSTYAEFAARSQQSLPQCSVVIKECSDFCGTVGQLEYSGCGGLALAAGFTLGPPTGAAVGFYCTGNVYLAAEQCKSRCQTPTVVCSWN